MKTTRFVLIALLAGASLMAPMASQAETIFERFAPPLLLPVPVPGFVRGPEIRVQTAPVWHDDYDRDYRYEHRYERRHDRYDHRHDRRYDRRHDRHDRRDYRRDRHDHYRD